MPIANTLPKHLRPRREKIFGLAKGFPHDRNARVRIQTYVLAWNAKQKQEGQHNQWPITAAYQRVLHALLWHFTSYRDGLCFPSWGQDTKVHFMSLSCERTANIAFAGSIHSAWTFAKAL